MLMGTSSAAWPVLLSLVTPVLGLGPFRKWFGDEAVAVWDRTKFLAAAAFERQRHVLPEQSASLDVSLLQHYERPDVQAVNLTHYVNTSKDSKLWESFRKTFNVSNGAHMMDAVYSKLEKHNKTRDVHVLQTINAKLGGNINVSKAGLLRQIRQALHREKVHTAANETSMRTANVSTDVSLLHTEEKLLTVPIVLGVEPSSGFTGVFRAREWYVLSVVGSASVMATIYRDRGISVCFWILTYVLSLALVGVLLKNVYVRHDFGYPKFVTALHFFSTYIVSLFFLWRRGRHVEIKLRTLWFGVIPVGLTTALHIATSNMSLVHCDPRFFEMMSSTSVLVTAAVGVGLGMEFNQKLVPPLMLIVGGLLVVSFTQPKGISLVGLGLVVIAVLFRAVKSQLQAMLLEGEHGFQQFEPMYLVYWTSLVGFVVMVAWSFHDERDLLYTRILDWGTGFALVASSANAVIVNISAMYLLKELGPVAQQAVGALKGALACICTVAVFGEQLSVKQMVGYTMLVLACYWYNKTDVKLRRAKLKRHREDSPLVQQSDRKV